MKRLIICRHGEIDVHRHLSYDGKLHIRSLGCLLRSYLAKDAACVKLLTSSAPRAVDSTQLLIQTLGIAANDVVRSCHLWTGDGPQKQDDMLALLLLEQAAASAEVLVVMTHLEYCESLPSMYAHRLGLPNVPSREQIHRGQARILDCETGECVTVGRKWL